MRLIDADILKGYFLKDAGPHPTEVMWEYRAIETEIDSCPTVDAEPDLNGETWKECYLLAIEALEKQIPKKPYMDNENGVYEKEHCPTCHRSLFPYDHQCPCGQAIDWSDT